MEQNIVFEDKQSTMRLALNGTMSSSKQTKHIKARYYFIKDKIDEGEVDLMYCPTEMMTVDILSRPKCGAAFRRDRAKLMNVPIDYDNEVEGKNTHPDHLPKPENSGNLGSTGIQKSSAPSRSVLSDVTNDLSSGILRSGREPTKSKNMVSWRDVVMGTGPLGRGNHYS